MAAQQVGRATREGTARIGGAAAIRVILRNLGADPAAVLADPEPCRLLQQPIDALAARHGEEFPEQVRCLLRTALQTGHTKADQIAAMYSRTLNRRLMAFGTSIQKLADESRFEIARQMLENSAIGVSEIAAALDYADASAFTRACKLWSGTTPARWRAQSSRRRGRWDVGTLTADV